MLRTWRPHTNYSECHATPTLRTPLRANATRPYNTVSHFAPVLAATLARYCLRSACVRNCANGSQPRPVFAPNMRARNINSLTTLYMLYGVYVTYIHSPNSGAYVSTNTLSIKECGILLWYSTSKEAPPSRNVRARPKLGQRQDRLANIPTGLSQQSIQATKTH